MTYLPPLPPVVPPPRNLETSDHWKDFFKRYMSDHSQHRDVLRAWIVSAKATLDDYEDRIATLESAPSGSSSVDDTLSAVVFWG